jgi:protein-disulfide isomerase
VYSGGSDGRSRQTSSVARKPVVRKKPPAQKRPSGFMVALAFAIAIAAAAALIVGAIVTRGDDDSPPPSEFALDLEGIPQDGPILGSPDARVTLVEYADLQCPACRAFAEAVLPNVVDRYVRSGNVKTEFRGLAFIGEDSERALRFVLAAGLQDRLWQLEDALYRNQGAENSGWVTDDLVRELAGAIEGLDVDRVFEDADGAEVTAMMQEDASQAQADEVGGTPTLMVQIEDQEPYMLDPGLGSDELAAALDDALAR